MAKSLPDAMSTMTHADIVAEMDVRRRARVRTADRERRAKETIAAIFMCIPFIWMYQNGQETGDPGTFGWIMILWTTGSMFGVPAFLVKALLPEGESWASRRRLPTFVPPPALLENGEYGDVWTPNREDVIFGRIGLVLDAVDRRDADALQPRIRSFLRRAGELSDPRTLGAPSSKSRYHYWPNRKTESGSREGDTVVTYEDNHPIQHQRSRLRDVVGDLRQALGRISKGVDGLDVSIAVRDIVAVLRRVIELEGFDASQLRPAKTAVIDRTATDVDRVSAHRGPGADVIALVRKALTIDPDLTDGLGNPIAPLLTRHVPRLLEIYRQAMSTATEDERTDIDRDLLEGLEMVRRATEEGLARHSDERRRQMRTEIAFLRMRGAGDGELAID